MYLDSKLSEAERLKELYMGKIFVFSPTAVTKSLCEHARRVKAPGDAFARHPYTKELIRQVLAEVGCDLERTYLELSSTPNTTETPHRDTWYAAPPAQINWHLALQDTQSDILFYPAHWSRRIANSSHRFNYHKRDDGFHPKAEEPLHPAPHLHLIPSAGELIVFSGAHLYATLPKEDQSSRTVMDFHSVHIDDLIAHRGAPNLDAHPTGTSLYSFVHARGFQRLPERIALAYEDPPVSTGIFIPLFSPALN